MNKIQNIYNIFELKLHWEFEIIITEFWRNIRKTWLDIDSMDKYRDICNMLFQLKLYWEFKIIIAQMNKLV